MRNIRNTVADNYRSDQRNMNSKERKTNNAQHLYSQNRNHSNNNSRAQQQKMARKIIDVMLKCPQQPRRGSISINLSPNQKTFYSTIASLLYSMDTDFPQGFIDLDFVIKMLNFFKYPYHYTKNAFQPIGAQHTWHICLQMLQFIAQLAEFHFEYTMQLADCSFEKTFIDIVLTSYIQNNQDQENQEDDSIIENWINDDMKKQKKEEEHMNQKIERLELEYKNKRNAQKTIPELQEQEEEKTQILNKEIQMVIELDQNNTGKINEITKVEEQLEEWFMKKHIFENNKKSLEEEMSNQQLNMEQAKKMEIQIQALKKQCNRIKEFHERKMSEGIIKEKEYIEGFLNFESEVKSLNDIRENYEEALTKRNIQIPQINIDHNLLSGYFSETNERLFEQKVRDIFETDKIKKMMKAEEFLYTMLDIENRQISQEYNNLQTEIAEEDEEISKLQRENEKLFEVNQALEEQIISLEDIDKKLDQDEEIYNKQDFQLGQLLQKYREEDESIIQQIRNTKAEMAQVMKLVKTFEEQSKNQTRLLQEQEDRICEYLTAKTEGLIDGFETVRRDFEQMKNSLPRDTDAE